MTMLLDVRNLIFHYADRAGPVRAVDSVSFALASGGSALGLVGESGSGKSSLALSIMRMLPPNVARYEGEIWLDGQELLGMADDRFRQEIRWRKLALVPQGAQNGFNPVLRVGEQIIEPLVVSGNANKREARARALELLAYVGLPADVFVRYPHELIFHYADRAGPVRAVDSVSFALASGGSALGLVGESGSGKSSLALSIMRMLPPNVARYEGEIWLDGQELLGMADDRFRQEIRWRKLALVPQGAQNGFNPVLRVGEQIIEPLVVSGNANKREARARALELLAYVGLPADVFVRYPHELSGGMKQRAMIAAALILQPPLVIMDEPTSALDASVQTQITNLLKQLKRDMNLSIIFITHDIALASDVCDDLAVVYAGQIVEIGSAEQVLLRPSHPYTQRLLASIPRLHTDTPPQFIPGAPPDLRQPPTGCRFHPRCPLAFDHCAQEIPPAFEPADGQLSRCWLLEDGEQ